MARQKVGVACDRCRYRKIKCDAKKPTCSPCISRDDTQCIYSGRANYRGSQQKQQTLFPRALTGPSEQPSPVQPSRRTPVLERPMAPPPARPSVTSPFSPFQNNRVDVEPQSISIPSNTPVPTTPTKSTPSQDVDAMTGVGKDQLPSSEFFGGSSAISFTAQINSAIDAHLGQSSRGGIKETSTLDGSRRYDQASMYDSSGPSEEPIDPLALSLPPKAFADGIVQDYFDLVWNVLPIHDWPTFKHDYTAVWSGTSTETPTRPLYCLINVILALGSQFARAVQPAERERTGQTFWERALVLFDPRLQANASLEGIQCLLLMGLFLQSTNHSHQCWMVVGSAVRMAQTLGLHLPRTAHLHAGTPRDIELTRRVWHGCVFMDRVMSMTFGRPSMIAKWLYEAVPLPSMIDDDALLRDTVADLSTSNYGPRATSRSTIPIIAFFIKSVELYSIVNDSLLELYMQQRDEQSEHAGQNLSSVLQLDDRLGRWAQSVPQGLRYSGLSNDSFVIQRQRINLRARYLHARILVLRPLLAEACLKQVRSDLNEDGPSDSDPLTDRLISHEIVGNCSNICSESAHEIINIIFENLDLDTVTGPVPAWWFAVLFVYTAATVLLAERFRHFKSSTVRLHKDVLPSSTTTRDSTLESAWSRAVQILQAYAKVGGSARRCVAALEIIQAKIQAQQQHTRPYAGGPVHRNVSTSVVDTRESHRPGVSPKDSDHQYHQRQQRDGSLSNDDLSRNSHDNTSTGQVSAASMSLGLPAYEDYGQMVDLSGMDFDIDSMLWLNTSAADIFS